MTTSGHPYAHVKRNFVLNGLEGIFFFTGMIFLAPESVLPVLIARLGGSKFLVSLIPVLRSIGFFLPSIFVASYVQSLRRKKPYIVTMAVLQRLPFFAAAVLTLLFGVRVPGIAAAAVLGALFISSAAGGLVIPAYFYFTAKTIPVDLRGRLFAIRNLVSYLLGLAVGGVIAKVLASVEFPDSYALLIFAGSVVMSLCIPAVLLAREPDARKTTPRRPLAVFLRGLPAVLAADRNLRWYVAGRVCFVLGFASYSYFALHMVSQFGLGDAEVGVFTVVISGSFVVVTPLLGVVADRKGHLINHIVGMSALIAGNIVALVSPWYWLSLATLAAGATAQSALNVSGFALPMEFGDEHDVPVYLGIVGLFAGAASILILGMGFAAERLGVAAVFGGSLFFSVAGLGIFVLRVRDPRKRVPPPIHDAR